MLVIAHRGANREALENSWSAFTKAVEAGAARIELDVQMTADGELAVIHDTHLHRTAGIDAHISALTRAELSRLKLSNGESIPFLDEVVERFLHKVELNIEIKGNTPADGEEVARIVKRHGSVERTIISCFHQIPLAYLADEHPDLPRACLWGDVVDWPFVAHFSPAVFMQNVRATVLHPWANFVDENLMDQARARGWKVYPWTSFMGEETDKVGVWTTMKTLGVDGLCTNYPRELKHWLEKAASDARRYTEA